MSVYVIQQPVPNKHNWTPDLTKAEEFGPLKYIFSGGENVYALPSPMLRKAQETLKDFDPQNDYILWPNTGDPAALWTVCFSLVLMDFKKVQILYWNRKRVNGKRDYDNGFYAPITYDLKRMV